MQTEWYQEMQKQIVSLATEALKAADAPLDMREGLMGLVIQRAVVFGHQECMRRLREQGVLEGGTVPAMRAVETPTPAPAHKSRFIYNPNGQTAGTIENAPTNSPYGDPHYPPTPVVKGGVY